MISLAEARGFEAMAAKYPADYRNNDRLVLDDPALADRMFAKLRAVVPQRWDEAGRWRLAGFNPRFRFCRYRGGQHFTVHRDGAWSEGGRRRSWLTVMLYLNDAAGFEGGQTRFYGSQHGTLEASIPPREGQAIIFDHRLWHDGAPVTRGSKYVMRTDVMFERVDDGARPGPTANGGLKLERVLEGHSSYVWALAKAADGALLSGGRDGSIRKWSLADGAHQVLRRCAGSVTALLEVGGQVWSGHRGGLLSDGAREWTGHDGAVLRLERLSDGSIESHGADGKVARWSPTGAVLGATAAPSGWSWRAPTRVSLELPGKRQVTAGDDGRVEVRDESGALLGEGQHHDFVRCLIDLGGGQFASGSYDETIAVWSTNS